MIKVSVEEDEWKELGELLSRRGLTITAWMNLTVKETIEGLKGTPEAKEVEKMTLRELVDMFNRVITKQKTGMGKLEEG